MTTTVVHAKLHATVAGMVAIQIRDVPESLRDDLAAEAKSRGLSLQAFLREVLEVEGQKARNREFLRTFEPVPVSGNIGPDEIVRLIEQGRAERDQRIMDAITKS